MIINGAHNRSLSFELFAFEEQPKGFHPEDNWIEIDFHLKDEKKSWHVTCAFLTAAEVIELAQWLDDIGNRHEVKRDLYFLEPNISFHLMYDYGKTKLILITLNAELRPEWHIEDREYTVLGHVGNRQLTQIAYSLKEQLMNLYIKAGCVQIEMPFKV